MPPLRLPLRSQVTMVSQGSVDRAGVYDIMTDAWAGPKVAVFAILNHTQEVNNALAVKY